MILSQPLGAFDADAAAAGLVKGTDYAAKEAGADACRVVPLTVKGLRYLSWTRDEVVPVADVLALHALYLAKVAALP